MPAARPTEALIERTLRAWMACGLPVGGVEVKGDGTVRVLAPDGTKPVASPETPDDEESCALAFGVEP